MSRGLVLGIALAVIVAVVVGLAVYWFSTPRIIEVRISTTTSLYQTGLLEYLADKFREKYPNVKLEFIAVGTGRALKLAERGDVCATFVHAPSLEKRYIKAGVIGDGRIFAYNYFIIVGPRDDPAGVRSAKSAVEAFKLIYRAGEEGRAKFVSRGDNSGTNIKELSLWRAAGLDPSRKPWYKESGQGMSETLVMADEMGAYTLSDISTFLSLKKKGRVPHLEILYDRGEELINIYSAYIVKSCRGVQRGYAEKFIEFVAGPEGQRIIAEYGKEEFGKPLFGAAAPRLQELKGIWERLARG